MKLKTINNRIKTKMDEWVGTLPSGIQKAVKDSIVVTGGCIASMLLKEPVNDYDVYLSDYDALMKLASHYGLKTWEKDTEGEQDRTRVRILIKSSGARKYKKPDEEGVYKVVYVTENAITLSDQVQVVTRFIGDAATIHENYDFIHATNYWTYKDGLVLNQAALSSLLTKELFYSGSKYPLCSIIRTRKFVARGFTINAGQYLKMAFQLNKLDLTDIDVLRDQLIGVDSAYFEWFLISLESKMKKEPGIQLQEGYLMNLVDYVFNG
jgi:hypothetical protein